MSSPRVDRTMPPGPAATAAAILLLLSGVFSLLLGLVLLSQASNRARMSRDFGLGFGRAVLVVFGLIAVATAVAKGAAGAGILARRPWAGVLGIVLASLDGLFMLARLGGRGSGVVLVELAVDVFVVVALVLHLRAMPKEAAPGSSWSSFGDRPGP